MIISKEKPAVEIQKGAKAYHEKSSKHKGTQKERKQGIRDPQNTQKTVNKMAILSLYLTIIT